MSSDVVSASGSAVAEMPEAVETDHKPAKKTGKKTPVKPTKKAPSPPAKKTVSKKTPSKPTKKKGGATTFERRSSEEVAKADLGLGVEFHGARLMQRNPADGRRGATAELSLDQLELAVGINPRTSAGDISELASSIKAEGLLSSLVVRPSKKPGRFDVIAGERRFRAMKAIDYKDPIPCVIRTDAIGDDARAIAIAIAENSEDGRTNLNMIEIGRACAKLVKEGWSVTRVAREAGLHSQRVNRSLALIDTPEAVQKNVANGTWSQIAALEYARLDTKTRDRIKDRINQATTAADIRSLRKEAERESVATKAAKGVAAKVSKKPVVATWRGSREKTQTLQGLCAMLEAAEANQIGTPNYHEVRGAIGVLLWDRGDRNDPVLPDLKPAKGPDYASDMKDLTAFNAIVKAEAAKYVPPTATA